MRQLSAGVVCLALSACAPQRRPVAPRPSASEQLAAVEAEVRAGCLDCLTDAYHRLKR